MIICETLAVCSIAYFRYNFQQGSQITNKYSYKRGRNTTKGNKKKKSSL